MNKEKMYIFAGETAGTVLWPNTSMYVSLLDLENRALTLWSVDVCNFI